MNDETFVSTTGCGKSKKSIHDAEERLADHMGMFFANLVKAGVIVLQEIPAAVPVVR